jgi:triacylglycerol lipase
MTQLNPTQVFNLADEAYNFETGDSSRLRKQLIQALPFVNIPSLKVLSGTSGLISQSISGFGFMAQLNGGRSTEIVIATRGTATMADVGTDINAMPMRGPTGHLIHKGFGTTFKSYVQQLNAFLNQQKLGFKPTAVHCMGHSLGGALANLNAAACAELGLNSYLYTVAAPRVGMVPYAEHLSRKMNATHVYRVANETDVVTMVPCFPFVHSPYVHGTYLLDGGLAKISLLQHMMSIGYKSMVNNSWEQMLSFTRSRQQQLEFSMHAGQRPNANYFERLIDTPGAMLSGRMLKQINMAIHELLSSMGARNLLCVGHYRSGSFTVLDQISEMLARYAQASFKRTREVIVVLNAVMAYLGRTAMSVADATMTTIRWVFGLLHASVTSMAIQAVNLVTS